MSAALFTQIEKLIPTLGGWCSVERACETAAVVMALRPKRVLVIGVWSGRDTFACALACRAVGSGQVIAVDPWQAEASIEGQGAEDTAWWSNQKMHEDVYDAFIRSADQLGLGSDWLEVCRVKSDELEPFADIELALIDGNHSDQAVKDVERFCPGMRIGSMLYADDLKWNGGGVLRAVEKLKEMGFIELHKRDSGAWFQRISK